MRDELLPRAGLSGDENREIRASDELDLIEKAPDRGAPADDLAAGELYRVPL